MPVDDAHPTGTPAVMLSVCMIVKNEAALLERCLESVRKAADQIVVVDTGSTDATKEIARRFNAEVVESEWRDDFAFARNISLEHATGTWVLWLDADDVVPAASLPLLRELKQRPPDCVYHFIIRNERPGDTGTEFTQARMFPNRPELRFERRIHEQIMPSALRIGLPLRQCTVVVEHHGYADPEALKRKAERNVRMLLEEYPLVAPDAVMAVEIADSCQLIGDDEKARQWYQAVLDIHGSAAATPVLAGHAHHGLGTVCSRRERYSEAIDHFNRALRFSPSRPDTLFGLAVAQELTGDYRAAVDSLGRIPRLKHQAGQVGVDFRLSTIKAFLRMVRLLCEQGCFDEARHWVQEAIATVGHRPEIHTLAGKFYLKTNALIEALHAFEKSLQLRREGNIEAYIGLCLIYRHARRDEKVAETLDAIRPFFIENERYRAFRRAMLGSDESSGPPVLSDEQYQEQLKKIQRDFFGMGCSPNVRKHGIRG